MGQPSVPGVSWRRYSGQTLGPEKGSLWNYSLDYPSGWHFCMPIDPERMCVQNIPESGGSPSVEFAKFEMLSQDQSPMLSDEAVPYGSFTTVEIAGERGVLVIPETVPNQARVLSAVFQHGGRWFSLAGYIDLPVTTHDEMQQYTEVLLHMMSSLAFGP